MASEILIVDDDPRLREVVRYALHREGFLVREAKTGKEALDACLQSWPDLVVLDVLMPEMDGIEACRRIRQQSRVPILFLSSRGEEVDKVLGLELGGDDYITKPFSTRELVSRVKAVLRRVGDPAGAPTSPVLEAGPLRLDPEQVRVFVHQTEVVLTATEFRLLHVLLGRPGRVFSRDELIDRAYDGLVVSDRTIDSHVRRIRQKLRAAGSEQVIETVHGMGFRLVP